MWAPSRSMVILGPSLHPSDSMSRHVTCCPRPAARSLWTGTCSSAVCAGSCLWPAACLRRCSCAARGSTAGRTARGLRRRQNTAVCSCRRGWPMAVSCCWRPTAGEAASHSESRLIAHRLTGNEHRNEHLALCNLCVEWCSLP